MAVIAGQIKQLEKIVESNPPSRMQLPAGGGTPSPRQRTISTSSETSGVADDGDQDYPERQLSMERDTTPLAEDQAEGKDPKDPAVDELVREGGSCAIS